MRLDWQAERRGGVALVECVLENGGETHRRARLENRLDGPVWPPRRRGRPVRGWDEDGFEDVLAPGEVRPVGYACPAAVVDPPVELTADEEASVEEGADATPAAVTAALGDPRPPRDAVESEVRR
ncbi:MAG: hypothetical protein ABEJ04_05330 [Halobacteriaceae archaeon]